MVVLFQALVLAATMACQQSEGRAAGEVSVTVPMRAAPVATTDEAVRSAQSELADDHAWPATRIVMPVLRSPERRTPEALLVAARAAAAWRGWGLVDAMLAFEPWLDSRFEGEGRELLARAALERGRTSDARPHAEAALRLARDPGTRAARQVLLARILDRLEVRDSSAALYKEAADALPLARDWLLLRTAGVTRDQLRRERLYAGVWSVAARERIPYSEAQALERFRMVLAAADAYEKLGDNASAYRLRLSATRDPGERARIRGDLLRVIRAAEGDELARTIEVLDAAFPQLDAGAQMSVSRRAAAQGLSARAASGFARAPARVLRDSDVLAWGRALSATGRFREAARRLQARRFGTATAPAADYVRAHALVRSGSTTPARRLLRHIIDSHASSRSAADALYLMADLEVDAGRERQARDLYDRACRHRSPATNSDNACFRSAMLSYALGEPRRAALAFDALPERFPRSAEAAAATYWAGRAWERTGNDSIARARWQSVASNNRLSYYAAVSARKLGRESWIPRAPELRPTAAYSGALERAMVLERLGMETEKRYEYESIERDAANSLETTLAVGAKLLELGEAPRAIRLGWRAVEAGRPLGDERGYALVYPVVRRETLIENARANRLDPALVAAVIRQESSWHPRATSVAGARGLMQVMPDVGRQLARSRDYPIWDPLLLYDPDVSLELGTIHLRSALSQYSSLPRALAAYNAGSSRVRRWSRRAGAEDPEVFIERIPYTETRDYVRIVLRNAELYRALYGLTR